MRKTTFVTGGSDLGNYLLQKSDDKRWFLRTVQAKGHSLFRCIPAFNERGEPEPQSSLPVGYALENAEDAEKYLSNAFFEAETCSFFGDHKLHMISEVSDPPEDVDKSPASVFFAALNKFKKDHPRECPQQWHDWMSRKHGPPSLSRPSRAIYIQGILLEHQGKPIVDRKTGKRTMLKPTVLQLTTSTACRSLMSGLTYKPGEDGSLAAVPDECILGEIIDLNKGKVIKFSSKLKWNEQLQTDQNQYKVEAGQIYPVPLAVAKGIWEDWNKVLRIPDSTWSIERIAESFSPEAVIFALSDTPYASRISDAVRKAAARGSVPAEAVSVPGANVEKVLASAAVTVAPKAAPVAAPVAAPRPAAPKPADALPGFDEVESDAPEVSELPPVEEEVPVDMSAMRTGLSEAQQLLATMNLPKRK